MSAPIDDIGVHARIRQAILVAGSQKAFAEKVGVSPPFLNAVLHARRPPTDAILAAAGIKRVVNYYEVPTNG